MGRTDRIGSGRTESGPDHDARGDRETDTVVVPGIEAPSSLTALRSLARHGVDTIVVRGSETPPVCYSKYCLERYAAPDPTEDPDGYLECLFELARRRDVTTILPLREIDIYLLSTHREAFGRHVATPWPPVDEVRRVQDWLRLRDVAEAAGVPVPETRLLDEWDEWDRPTVVKSRYSIQVDGGVKESETHQFAAGEEPDEAALVAEMGHVPIVQEYVPGSDEHGFFALYDGGEPTARFQHRRIRSYSYAGGASVYRESVNRPDLETYGSDILSELGWHGPAMVEFKRDERDGELKLMEINPRFWGSLALSVHAGVDFPYRYYGLAADRSLRPVDDYEVGVGCHLVRGELSYLFSVLRDDYANVERPALTRALYEVALSTVRQPNFDVLDSDDPRPFAADLLNTAGDAVSELIPR